MIGEVVEQVAVFHEELLEPGAVGGAELRQRFLSSDRPDLTHVHKRTEGLPRRSPKPTVTSACALVMEWR